MEENKNIELTPEEEAAKWKSVALAMAKQMELDLEEKPEINWNQLVRPEGRIQIEGEEYITLAELRRLARLRGYLSSRPKVVQVPEYDNGRHTTVEWELVWADGTVDGAAADAYWKSVNPGFRNYVVAIASNRAEARCIRAALGIDTCSYEEVGPDDEEDFSGPITDQQKAGIEMLLKRNKIGIDKFADVFGDALVGKIVKDNKVNLDGLTHQDAVKMMGCLNKYKKE